MGASLTLLAVPGDARSVAIGPSHAVTSSLFSCPLREWQRSVEDLTDPGFSPEDSGYIYSGSVIRIATRCKFAGAGSSIPFTVCVDSVGQRDHRCWARRITSNNFQGEVTFKTKILGCVGESVYAVTWRRSPKSLPFMSFRFRTSVMTEMVRAVRDIAQLRSVVSGFNAESSDSPGGSPRE